jgi:hypothetical protein
LIFGTIGAANRLKCGVLGDAVNLAARFQELARQYGVGFLITDTTRNALPDPGRFAHREVDLVEVVGRQTVVGCMRCLTLIPPRCAIKKTAQPTIWQRDLDCTGRTIWTGQPDDPVAPMLLARCEGAAKLAPGQDWTGVARMHTK